VSAIVGRFESVYRAEPTRPLIVLPTQGRTITAEDTWHHHHDLMRHLGRVNLREGDLLVSAIGNRPELVPVLLACRALGLALMAVDPGATVTEVRSLCVAFGAKALLTSAAGAPGDGHEVGGGLALFPGHDEPVAYPGTAMLKLTSGSSGPPRAVRTIEAQLVADGSQIIATMGIEPGDTQLAVIPLGHAYGLGVIVMPLLLQGTGMVLRDSFVPQQLVADAREFGARRLPGVPFMFEHLIAHPPADGWPASLTRLVSAGARLAPETVRGFYDRFGVKVHTYYGATEAGGITYDASDAVDEATTVGHPLVGVSLALHPEDDLAPGSGRVHVRSAAVSDGYVGPDRGDFIEEGFLTGDCGHFDRDGRLTLIGRVSSFINVAGRKVQPDEVEGVLRRMPGIADARVVGAPDALRGQQVVACVVQKAGMAAPSPAQIRRFCASQLAAHKLPRAMFFVDAIPLNARGKTDRAALEELVRRHV